MEASVRFPVLVTAEQKRIGLLETTDGRQMHPQPPLLEAIGDTVGFAEPTSPSYGVTPGFVSAFGPASEVLALTFDDATTISWGGQPNATGYNIYSHDLGSLSGTDNGGCLESTVAGNSYLAVGTPAAAEGFFYLVTAINRLAEEGTPGSDSQGTERGNAGACP